MDRDEVFRATGPTSGTRIKVKMGVSNDGKLTAAEVWMAFEAGAYAGSPVGAAGMTVIAAYDIPHFLVEGYDVVCNKPRVAAYRAPGAPMAAFAVESVLDELARSIDMDPIDLNPLTANFFSESRLDTLPSPRRSQIEFRSSTPIDCRKLCRRIF